MGANGINYVWRSQPARGINIWWLKIR